MSADGPFALRSGTPDGDPDLGPLLRSVDAAAAALREIARDAGRMGLARTALYASGAEGSLRIAEAAAVAAWSRSHDPADELAGVRLLGASGFALRPTGDRMIGERVRVVERPGRGHVLEPADGQDDDPVPPGRSLAAELVASRPVRTLARGPVFAGLLQDALARHDWWCPAADVRWTADAGAAGAVVDAASRGRWRVRLGPRDVGGLVDRQVADLLAAIGWRPMADVGLPDPLAG